jgi:lysine 6-dehydrogenase
MTLAEQEAGRGHRPVKYLILGAGMMGRAAAFDLARFHTGAQIVLADIDLGAAERCVSAIGSPVQALQLDVNNASDLRKAAEGATVILSAVSYAVNLQVSRAALETGSHMVDLGGNNDVVRRQIALDAEARAKGIAIIPNCGLAPGLVNILAAEGIRQFDEVDRVSLRVGGLPQHPRPPLNYQIVFSAEGLINEYVEKATALRDGRIVEIESMSDLEEIEFAPPFGTLEAFTTSGGLSLLPELFAGRVHTLDYKTIRYPGHCEKFRTLLELGFATAEPVMIGHQVRTSRELFAELLRRKLDFGDTDVVLVRATIAGRAGGKRNLLTYECIDYQDEASGITAMMRTTAYPTTIIAQMLAEGTLATRGVMPPEYCVPAGPMIARLNERSIRITSTVSEMPT